MQVHSSNLFRFITIPQHRQYLRRDFQTVLLNILINLFDQVSFKFIGFCQIFFQVVG